MHTISQYIRNRRSIFPPTFTDQRIPDEWIWEILENANHAPTHKLTQPWRFRVISDDQRAAFAKTLAEAYRSSTPADDFMQKTYDKQVENAMRSSHIIAIGMHRAENETLPEWEDIAAVSMAVENMWITVNAMGLGGFWSTPKMLNHANVRRFLQWNDTERGLGFFYLGHHQAPETPRKRTPIESKMLWLR